MGGIKKGDQICHSVCNRLNRIAEGIDQQAALVENGVVQQALGNVTDDMRLMANRLETFRRNEYGARHRPSEPDPPVLDQQPETD